MPATRLVITYQGNDSYEVSNAVSMYIGNRLADAGFEIKDTPEIYDYAVTITNTMASGYSGNDFVHLRATCRLDAEYMSAAGVKAELSSISRDRTIEAPNADAHTVASIEQTVARRVVLANSERFKYVDPKLPYNVAHQVRPIVHS